MDYQICARCVMDTSDPEIDFDEQGHCNHCRHYLMQRSHLGDSEHRQRELESTVAKIKSEGVRKRYDCVLGVSGGTDSTYLAYLGRKLGLRILAVHVDNGWNAELAVGNIEQAMERLEIDLFTHVLDWDDFSDLQLSFLRASVSDAELPSDHAIRAVQYRVAREHGIRFVLTGRNFNTEGILPWSWTYSVMDWRYIKDVHRRHGSRSLRTFPHYSLLDLLYYVSVRRIRLVNLLNFYDYRKDDAVSSLQSELGWRDYGGKHYESIYTRFFQAHILPGKFGIDKRRAHLSVLVCTEQMSRSEALEELSRPPYPDPEMERSDKEYVCKKLGLSVADFDRMMREPTRSFREYRNNAHYFLPSANARAINIARHLRRMGLLPTGFGDHALRRLEDREAGTQ